MPRTILITGSAKRLGAAIGLALAREGHRVAIHYRTSQEEAEQVVRDIREQGGEAEAFASPLAHLTDGAELVEAVVAKFGGLDTLINNAGTFSQKKFEEMSQHDWDTGWTSTAGSAFVATRAALPHLRASKRGRIVNIGDSLSDQAGFAEPAMSYYIGKVGVWMMTQTLASTEAEHGVTVNMISPGVLEGSICATPVEEMPLGRYGVPEDVIGSIRFLLEESSQAVTGTNLQIGGGWNQPPLFDSVLKRYGYTKSPPAGTS